METRTTNKRTGVKLNELIGELETLEHKCYDSNNEEGFYESIILAQHWLMDAAEIIERDEAYSELIKEMKTNGV